MGFWGVEVKPGKPYPCEFDDVRGMLHLTQATLGNGSSAKKSVVQCSVGDNDPVFLCSLLPDKIETCPLNLEFEGNDSVAFSVIGPRSVHLSGFFKVNERDIIDGDYESDSYGEDIAETETDESTDYDTEEEYDDDFIDNGDFGIFPPSPVPNSGVVIEEIVDDEKPANPNSGSRQLKKKKQLSESNDKSNSQRQITGSAVPVLESEDEDGFPVASAHNNKLNSQKPKADADEKIEQRTTKETKKKRRRDDPNKLESGANQPFDSSHPSAGVPENDIKKKNKKKRKQQSEVVNADEAGDEKMSNVPSVTNEQDQKLNNEKNLDIDAVHVSDGNPPEDKKKKKKKKKSKTQESSGDADKGKTVTSVGDKKGSTVTVEEKKDKIKPSQVRTYANGLVIEELAMGKPDGKRASPGNTVSVHYIGKLKKNDSIFDSNVGRAPFKFRLGVGQVIKGWDVGVNGMRIGDKRRLTIPPSMGYGAQGAGKKIPPNSWLVFDVELVAVR